MHLTFEQEALFPNLRRSDYQVTSERTPIYNCIAHAAGQSDLWWWPVECEGVTWPVGISREETLEAFIAAYGTTGYAICDSAALEVGVEKVAIYVDADGVPTHAARQLVSGAWSSKLGEWEDIQHAGLEALEDTTGLGLAYGRVAVILKRVRPELTPRDSPRGADG